MLQNRAARVTYYLTNLKYIREIVGSRCLRGARGRGHKSEDSVGSLADFEEKRVEVKANRCKWGRG